ncbi:CoA transferase [Acuticoccus sp.]|uniref:CaiB/BaiF CoA-transferase family protein n=1 Tax=Acuticoccus sp. TaxID=1904378 RepID=UPI003B520A83
MTPLAGLAVEERGDGVGVRFAGHMLVELGATVTRPDGPGPADIGYGDTAGEAYAAWLDRGKGTGTADAPDLVLTETADTANGALVARLTWFDPSGPAALWSGTDAIVNALAGLVYPFGPVDRPALPQGEAPQIIAGATLLIPALASLFARRAGSGATDVAASVHEAALCWTEGASVAFVKGGPASRRRGVNRYPPTYPATCWPTADGWLGATALTPAQWRGLCTLVGLPEMGADPTYATSEQRIDRADDIDAAMVPRLATRSAAAWAADGQAKRVPLTVTPHPGETSEQPHWQARKSFVPLDGMMAPRAPWRITPGAPSRPRTLSPTPDQPLAGLRVVDFSMGWSGPLATRHLADLGADVVKVESHAHPDWWRGWNDVADADPPPQELRPAFIAMNRNKRGVLLDLTAPEDLAIARGLVAQADVVVDNFVPGTLARHGLGPDDMQALSPGCVTIQMGAFGAFGPRAGDRGYGSTVEQASGLAFVNGGVDWPPCLQHVAFGDAAAGLFAAVSVLACFWAQPVRGASIDLAQVEVLFQIAASACLAEQVTGAPVPRHPTRGPRTSPTGVFAAKAADTWVVVEVTNDAAWAALCATLDRAGWARLDLADRRAREDEIEGAIADWTRERMAEDAAATLQAAGVAAAPVVPPHSLVEDPRLTGADFWHWRERRHVGRHLLGAAPYRLDGVRPPIRTVAPLMGEHDDAIIGPMRHGAAPAQ